MGLHFLNVTKEGEMRKAALANHFVP